ncbi:CPBP family intramembrane glutamic endopeptidase [Pseudoduganella sp. UC29_106]|uniref:CPBP family intramembrane glutamic endopeptidase n=1 Tax=Pseudoduganella sp. UC29_106 TaxID=3374553 RepID=UPI0037575C24
MDTPLSSAGRAFWLLLRLRMRRLVNMGGSSFRRRRSAGRSRPATAGRHGVRTLILLMLAGFMMTAFVSMASGTLINLHCHLDTTRNCAALAPGQHASAAELAAVPFSTALANAVSLELLVLLLVAVMLPLGSKELANADWDLEWLVTLPMRRATLLWSRVAERTVATPAGWLTVWPLTLMVAWHSGYRWSSPLLALLATLPLLLIASAIRTVADTGLRLRLAPSQLRNLQALASVASLPLMYFVMSLSMPNAALTMGWAAHAPAWLMWTPPGLIVQALNARSALAATAFTFLCLAQSALIVLLCMQALHRMLANGVVATGSRETGRRPAPAATPGAARRVFGTPLQRRELRLLSRDRNFLVQSLLLPVIIVGTQLIFNGTIDKASDLGADPRMLSVLAFAIGSYVLLLSAFQTLNREGQALWLLYTFPRSLESVLKEKAQLWAVLATAYPLLIFGIGLAFAARLDVHLVSQIILVLASIPIFTVIAVSLGVWASDPLAEEASHRVRPTFAYAYFVLCSFYSFALYTETWYLKLAVIVLMTALALSLWQKACDALPYLLDVTASPPPRVSAADGMIATLLFFALQILVLFIMQSPGHPPGLAEISIAFAISGGITWLLARLIYWRTRATGVPRILPANYAVALTTSVIMAAVAIATSALYLYALRRLGITLPGLPRTLTWILPLAILAAPLFEEFIFRGLIFGGLRRSMPLAAAMAASAAIFAVVHPPTSMLPVFILGLCTAWAYERTKSLLSPMLTHALYNAAMLALQY